MKRTLLVLVSITLLGLGTLTADDRKAEPDNTATNERDRSGQTLTSGDQSNSPADLKTTQAIRRAVMKDDRLSMTAKNIKIMTADGQVTLRGPVNTAEEKAQMVGLGIPEIEAKRYEEKLKKGNYLIAVHTDEDEDVDRAKQIFKTAKAEDISTVREASAPKV